MEKKELRNIHFEDLGQNSLFRDDNVPEDALVWNGQQIRPARRIDSESKMAVDATFTMKLHHEFTSPEMERIRFGKVAREMEEKWHIYYEDSRLHILRSWTSFEIYEVEFDEHRDGSATAVGLVVNIPESKKAGKNTTGVSKSSQIYHKKTAIDVIRHQLVFGDNDPMW
jgi:hypothetical protein